MSKPNHNFSIPTTELAKTKADNRAWIKQVAKEHGNTDPLKLEKRREKVSVLAIVSEEKLKEMQTIKKVIIAQHLSRKKDLIKQREKLAEGSPDREEFDQAIAQVEYSQQISVLQQDAAIGQHTANCALIEVLSLIVDSLTVRDEVVSKKSGKKGMIRWSATHILESISDDMDKLCRRTKKILDIQIADRPLSPVEPEDEEEVKEEEFTDEDIMSEEDRAAERAAVKKVAGGGA